MTTHRFASRVFAGAGIYGLVVLLPLYVMEQRLSDMQPPAITHPEFYYGFAGVGVAWQLAFLVIARDPPRYRPLMPIAMVEKISYGAAVIVLFLQGRLTPLALAGGLVDLALCVLFLVAYRRTNASASPRHAGWAET